MKYLFHVLELSWSKTNTNHCYNQTLTKLNQNKVVTFKKVNVINSALVAITQPSQKHRNKGYFDQNNTVLIPNVTQFVQKTYFIANKVRKFQLISD